MDNSALLPADQQILRKQELKRFLVEFGKGFHKVSSNRIFTKEHAQMPPNVFVS